MTNSLALCVVRAINRPISAPDCAGWYNALMERRLSEQTLSILRHTLEQMLPNEVFSAAGIRKFWQDALLEAGFAPKIIGMATSYNFQWSSIVPDLFIGKFHDKDYFSAPPLPDFSEQTLLRLLAFAIDANKNIPLGEQLRQSLISDGFSIQADSTVDSSAPTELAQIPGKRTLVFDVQEKLCQKELVAVLYMDLDGLQEVSETLGHAEGEKCLTRVAHIMSAAVRGKGRLYKLGENEFVALLCNFTAGEAASTAQRIRSAVEAENPGGSLKVTVSIGVVSSELGQRDTEALIETAERTMNTAKKEKHGVVIG
jgi:diguanylate cyclase (GGDEF)-like protein